MVVADTKSNEDRLITLKVVIPRIILAELNTHRNLSKNTSSSRAIPFAKMVEVVEQNPFVPIAFQRSHKGMQGTEYLSRDEDIKAVECWLKGRDRAVESAKELHALGVTKQICNRLLEPFMFCTVLLTGNKESFDHFYKLRGAIYEKNVKDLTFTEALKFNKGMAEIHMMQLAEEIKKEIDESKPEEIFAHIPFKSEIINEFENISYEDMIEVSVVKAARISYTTMKGQKELELKDYKRIYKELLEANPRHSSPFEHVANAMTPVGYKLNPKCGPYKGFISHRFQIEETN